MQYMTKSIILLLLTCMPLVGVAQGRLSLQTDISKILVHTSSINFDAKKNSFGFSLSYATRTNPDNESYARRGLPWVGLSLSYLDYGDPHIGKVYSIIPSVHFRHHVSDKIHLESVVGIGAGFATRYYDRQPWSDTLYNALGSHINNSTKLSEILYYHLPSQDLISISLGLQHVSSSAASAPNFGINNLSLALGYHFTYPERPPYGKPVKAKAAHKRDGVAIGYTFTTDRVVLGYEFPIYTFSYKHHWVDTSKLASWYIGAEVIYNSKRKVLLAFRHQQPEDLRTSQFLAYYISGGREWYMGDFGLCLGAQIGIDVYSGKFTHLEKPTLYYYPFNKNYSKQNLFRNTFLGLGLCTKFVNAQYLDMTLGTFF